MVYLSIALVALLAIYALLAKIVSAGIRMARQFDFESVTHDDFFARQTPEFMRYHQEMMAVGFVLSERLFTATMSPTLSDIATYRHEQATTVSAAIVSMSNVQLGKQFDYIEFYESYTDGSSLTMNNSNEISVFPRIKNIVKIQCDEVNTVRELLDRFRRVRAKIGKTPAPLQTNLVAQFHEFHAREMQALVDKGYFRASADDEYFIGTYAGGFKMTWQLLPVGKQIAMARRKRYAQTWLG